MKRIIYILILIGSFALNLEVMAEWIEKDGFFYMKDSLDAIRDFKVSDDGEIIAITKDNQIIKYDFETGEIKKRCKCEGDENYNQFAFVSKDLKTTSIVYNFDTLNNENVAYNLAIINNDDCSRIVNQKMEILEDYRVNFSSYNFSDENYVKNNTFTNIEYFYKYKTLIIANNCLKSIPQKRNNGWPMYAYYGITEFFKYNNINKLEKINQLNYLIQNTLLNDKTNELYIIGYNHYFRGELHFPVGMSGNESILSKYSFSENNFQNIDTHSRYSYSNINNYDVKNNNIHKSFIENKENKILLFLTKDDVRADFPLFLKNIICEYKNNEYQIIKHPDISSDLNNQPSILEFVNKYNDTVSNRFNQFYLEKNNLTFFYSNIEKNNRYNNNFSLSKIMIFKHNDTNKLEIITLPYLTKKYQIYIPNDINKYGGYLILAQNKLVMKKSDFTNPVSKTDFFVKDILIRVGDTLELQAYTTIDNLKYVWTFLNNKDTIIQNSFTIEHKVIFANSGIYNINLKIFNKDSLICEINKTNAIKVLPKLIADFDIKIDKQYKDIIYLSSTSKGDILKYEWDLDNGQISNEREVAIKNFNNCDYNFKLTVYDKLGNLSVLQRFKSDAINNQIKYKKSTIYRNISDNNYIFFNLLNINDSIVIRSNFINYKILRFNDINYDNSILFNFEHHTLDNYLENFTHNIISKDLSISSNENISYLLNKNYNFISNINHEFYLPYLGLTRNPIFQFEKYEINLLQYYYADFYNKDKFIFNKDYIFKYSINRASYNKYDLYINNKLLNKSDDLNWTSKKLDLTYTTYELFADNINNQIVGLIRKDSSNNFEIFETNEKLEIKRRDFSLPFDMEINEVKLINENKLAIVGHKKHQYTKGIGAIVLVDLRDLSFVVKEHNSRPTINNLRKINNSYYYAFGDVIGSQGYMIFDANFDLVRDIRLTDLEGELKDVEYLDNKFYLATEEHYLDTITPFRIEDKYKIRLYMDSVEVDLSEDITSVQTNPEDNFLIFPNPSSDKISFDLVGVGVADLVVYDVLGNEIMSIPNYTNKSEVDISNLSIGTYTIQIQTSTGSISKRLLVNR